MTTVDDATKKLIADLEAAPASELRDAILHNARKLCYHDFSDEGYTMPKAELIRQCRMAGLPDIIRAAEAGDYDQGKEACDEWAASEEGKATIAEFGDPTEFFKRAKEGPNNNLHKGHAPHPPGTPCPPLSSAMIESSQHNMRRIVCELTGRPPEQVSVIIANVPHLPGKTSIEFVADPELTELESAKVHTWLTSANAAAGGSPIFGTRK